VHIECFIRYSRDRRDNRIRELQMELQEEYDRIQIEAVADAFGSPFYPFRRRKQNGFIPSVFHNSIRTISLMLNAPKSTIAPVMATMGKGTPQSRCQQFWEYFHPIYIFVDRGHIPDSCPFRFLSMFDLTIVLGGALFQKLSCLNKYFYHSGLHANLAGPSCFTKFFGLCSPVRHRIHHSHSCKDFCSHPSLLPSSGFTQ
jgi:hypothetical protein